MSLAISGGSNVLLECQGGFQGRGQQRPYLLAVAPGTPFGFVRAQGDGRAPDSTAHYLSDPHPAPARRGPGERAFRPQHPAVPTRLLVARHLIPRSGPHGPSWGCRIHELPLPVTMAPFPGSDVPLPTTNVDVFLLGESPLARALPEERELPHELAQPRVFIDEIHEARIWSQPSYYQNVPVNQLGAVQQAQVTVPGTGAQVSIFTRAGFRDDEPVPIGERRLYVLAAQTEPVVRAGEAAMMALPAGVRLGYVGPNGHEVRGTLPDVLHHPAAVYSWQESSPEGMRIWSPALGESPMAATVVPGETGDMRLYGPDPSCPGNEEGCAYGPDAYGDIACAVAQHAKADVLVVEPGDSVALSTLLAELRGAGLAYESIVVAGDRNERGSTVAPYDVARNWSVGAGAH